MVASHLLDKLLVDVTLINFHGSSSTQGMIGIISRQAASLVI